MIPDRVQLRRDLRSRRRALPAAQRIAAADTLANQLLALHFLPDSGHVAPSDAPVMTDKFSPANALLIH